MEGRCSVETWADFGFLETAHTAKLKSSFGADLILCPGSEEVYVFSSQERKLKTVLQFPGPVSDLVESHDGQVLYVASTGGVFCVPLQLLLSRAQKTLSDASSGPAELQVSSECLVVPKAEEERVLSLLLVASVLLTVSQRDSSWVLTLYNTSPKESRSCELLSWFSLPLLSNVATDDVTTREKKPRPVLICVICGDAALSTSDSTLTDGCCFRLEPLLFKLLFGVDAALAKSPVVLFGLPDGRVCFLPLRLPGSRLRVLHSLEQPVVYLGVTVFLEKGPAQCLVAVGQLGRVLLMKTEKGEEGKKAHFIEKCVPGPVLCGCVDKSGFVYSTGSDLLLLDLSEVSSAREGQDGNKKMSSKDDTAPHRPTSLNVCRVVALAEPMSNRSGGGAQLLGLSVRRQLLRITLPVWRDDATLSKVPSVQVGRSVKDFLSAIGDVCERASALKTAIKSKNQTLQHLNQVINVGCLLKASENGDIQEKTIRCRAVTGWSRSLQKDSLNLTCVLDNSSPFVLERGWTLRVAVFPRSCSPDAGGGQSSSMQFYFPFHSLHPGETLEVSLPLAPAGGASFPVTVSCSLIFSLPSLLGEETAAAHRLALQSGCIALPLNTLTVDWLHALQVHSPTDTHRKVTSQSDNVTTDPVRDFLSSRQIRRGEAGGGGGVGGGGGGGESALKTEPESYSASVRVSAELLRDTLQSKSPGSDPPGPPQSLCLSLLHWLFSEGLGGVKSGHQGDVSSLSSPVVHARGPDGNTVRLTAKEVNVGEEEECLSTVEVQVESSSMAAVCGLHHSVLCRVQTLLLRAPEKTGATKRIQALGLRQTLQRAEHLLQQIQQSQVSEAFSVGHSTGPTTPSVLSFYLELRKNPLLII